MVDKKMINIDKVIKHAPLKVKKISLRVVPGDDLSTFMYTITFRG